jgi:hypothetical protein
MKRQILVFFILAAFVSIDVKVSYAKWVWSGETSWVDPEQTKNSGMLLHY